MKKFRKLFALVVAAAMVLAMSITAFAAKNDSITVNGTKEGEKLSIYKMFDLSVDDEENPTAYKYTVASDWSDFFTTGYGKDYVTIDATDGHITWKEGMETEEKMILLAHAAAAAAPASALKTLTATGETVVFEGLADGYYLITSTLGTKAMIETTPDSSAVTVNEKNPEDTITKQVQEDSDSSWGTSNDAQIGDTVNFKSTITIEPYTRNVIIHDTMDSGLAYQSDAAIAGLTAGTDYEVLATPATGDTFTIQIKDSYIAGLTATATLELTYTAKLDKDVINGDPAIVAQKNTTSISYGEAQSVEAETTTTTHKFEVYKHADGAQTNLADAIFQLKKNGTAINLVKIDATNYRVVDATETGTASTHVGNNGTVADVAANSIVSDFVTVASGNIVIWGVDSDSDYTLEELQAPSGYNKLANAVSVTVDDKTPVEIENESGTELPSTGGIGTTIFYILGSILVIGAGVLLVTKRRMDA